MFLLVSVCCDTAQATQALMFLLVSLCCDTAQDKAVAYGVTRYSENLAARCL